MSELSSYPCPYCEIGQCQPSRATYTTIYKGALLTVPDMPVAMCDICGYQEFDRTAIMRLESLLGQGDTPAENSRPGARPAALDKPDHTRTRRPKHER
jgi:YgiT-type zinc finger domain-containing protein